MKFLGILWLVFWGQVVWYGTMNKKWWRFKLSRNHPSKSSTVYHSRAHYSMWRRSNHEDKQRRGHCSRTADSEWLTSLLIHRKARQASIWKLVLPFLECEASSNSPNLSESFPHDPSYYWSCSMYKRLSVSHPRQLHREDSCCLQRTLSHLSFLIGKSSRK